VAEPLLVARPDMPVKERDERVAWLLEKVGLTGEQAYRYPHEFPGHAVEQEYRPPSASTRRYYEPSGQGEDVEREPGSGRRIDTERG